MFMEDCESGLRLANGDELLASLEDVLRLDVGWRRHGGQEAFVYSSDGQQEGPRRQAA